jgi:hypothetical protein
MLNNREWALLFWLGAFIVFILSKQPVRKAVVDLLIILFSFQIISHILIVAIYATISVWGLWYLKIWDKTMLKDTILWFFIVPLPLLFNSHNAKEEQKYFRKILFDNLKLTVILEYIVNFYVFNILIELLIVPILAFLGITGVYSEEKAEFKKVKKVADYLLGIFGIFILIFAIYSVISDYKSFFAISNFLSFISPVILTLIYIPFLYLLTLRMIYNGLKIRVAWNFKNDKEKTKLILRTIFYSCMFNMEKVKRVSKSITYYNTENKNELKDHIINCINNTK